MSSKRKSRQIHSSDDELLDSTETGAQRLTNGIRNGNHQSQDDLEIDQPVSQSHQSKKMRKTENPSPTHPRTSAKGKERVQTQRAETVDLSEEEEQTNHVANRSKGFVPSKGVRDSEGYLPGSIVRVALRNFVTYSSVEFSPGPYLNMIIGPNGTGKSTLVCAIVLGLGFPPSVLDRASEVKLFIKAGTEEGSVEIELKGHPGKKNVTIKLNLILANNSRVFEVNGKKATMAHVQELVQSFNIQANNLCCFLPQEKVSKFAEMKEPELLKETQKVAGHPKLYEWHEILIEDGKIKISLEAKLSTAQRALKDVEKQVQSLQLEVDRYQERLEIENKVQAYELSLEQNKYLQQKLRHDNAKMELVEAKAAIDRLEAANAPLNDQKKYFKRLSEQLELCHKKILSAATKCKSNMSKLDPAFKSTKQKLEDASDKVISLRDDERRRKELKSKLKMEVDQLAEKIKHPVEELDNGPFQEKLQSLSSRIRQISNDITNIQNQQKEIYEERRKLGEQQNSVKQEIANLESVSGRKEADLRQHVPNLFKALMRMRQMKAEGKFRGKAFEPIRLEISPKNSSYDRVVEGCLSRDLLNTFVFTDPHDYELMAEVCNDQEKLRVNLACMRPGDSLSNYQHPIPLDALKQFGFDDYVINLINGPDEVLAHICNQNRLNMIPIAHQLGARVDESRMHDRNFPIKSWILGITRFNVSYSSYGAREMIIKSMDLFPPRILNFTGVDVSIVHEKKATLASLIEAAAQKEQQMIKVSAPESDLRQEYDSLKEEKKQVEAAWNEARVPHVEYLKYVATHKSKSAALEKENAKPTLDQERAKRKAALLEASKEHTAIVVKRKNIASQLSRLSTTLITLNLRILQHQTDQKAFDALFKSRNSDLVEAKQIYEENHENVKMLFKQAKDTAKELLKSVETAGDHIREIIENINARLTDERELWKNDGLEGENALQKQEDDLKKLLAQEQMSLEAIHPVDRSIIDRYQRYKAQLEHDQKDLDSLESDTRRCQDKIKKIYDLWRPRLDELISNIDEKFDAAFKRMGCLGHIVVVEDPDFDKWGIEVQVSFRDNEPLVRLDPHRQSGGERSLSTIMYLMSLTELSKSPFSLVDEINQGMDRRAERLVHDQLVETTCRESASQYFLITPKLLFGLRYHPLMRVLCVNNGDWIPPDFKFGYWLNKAKAKRAKAL